MNDLNTLNSDIIKQELAKHGVAPNPQKEVTVTDANAGRPDVRTLREREEVEEKIKALQKKATFTYKLDGDQITQLERLAAGTGRSWKEELRAQIEEKIFAQKIGLPKISRPSNTTLITGPSNGKLHTT